MASLSTRKAVRLRWGGRSPAGRCDVLSSHEYNHANAPNPRSVRIQILSETCYNTMESLTEGRPHIVIEFKQGEDIEGLKDEALRQILDNRYYSGLDGEVLCIGIAHNKKRCAVAHETVGN